MSDLIGRTFKQTMKHMENLVIQAMNQDFVFRCYSVYDSFNGAQGSRKHSIMILVGKEDVLKRYLEKGDDK